jgi:hypothetical protein
MTWAISTPENLFGWVKGAMKDMRDELEIMCVTDICARVRALFEEAGGQGRAYRWTRHCGYFM